MRRNARSVGLRGLAAICCAIGTVAVIAMGHAAEKSATAKIPLEVRWLESNGAEDTGKANSETRELVPGQTAILICDTWNEHWCKSATRRCDALAKQMAPIIEEARARGVHIIHAPSDTLTFYKDHPARKRALAAKAAEPPSPIGGWCSLQPQVEGSLPIDDSDGGCDCEPQCKQGGPWSRQHPAIRIDDKDVISDNGQEVYNYLTEHGIKNIVYMGVHTNMCVLGRSFGIRQMTKLGFNTILVRDLTDTMYNPRMKPFVPHDKGTELVVAHIERHWCPTTTSVSLAKGLE